MLVKLTQLKNKVLKNLANKAQNAIADFLCENSKSQAPHWREHLEISVRGQRLESALERIGLFFLINIIGKQT